MGILYEYSHTVPQGIDNIKFIEQSLDEPSIDLPSLVRYERWYLIAQIAEKTTRIEAKTKIAQELSRGTDTARRLQTMPGVGPLTALAVKILRLGSGSFRASIPLAGRTGWDGCRRPVRLTSAGF